MTKRKAGSEVEVLQLVIEDDADISTELDKAVKHLLKRVLHPRGSADGMSVAEETAAIKACTAYYLDVVKVTPGANGEGGFNGFRDTVANIPANRRSRGASRDGATDDNDAF